MKLKSKYKTHGESYSRLYRIYYGIRKRCLNKNIDNYEDYGGRGITICDEWLNSYEAFRDWSYDNGYSDDLTIDRRDNDGNYEPSNCRWTTKTVQARNTRKLNKNNTTGYRGVCILKRNKKNPFKAQIRINGKRIYLGYFATAKEAALKYDKYVTTHNLEHTLNFEKDVK